MNDQKANVCGMTAIVIWFATPLLLVLTGDVPPFLVGAFSFLVAFFMVLGWWIVRGENIRQKFKMSKKAYALGFYGMALYNGAYMYAVKMGPPLEVNLLNYLWPAFLIIFGTLLQKTKLDIFAVTGLMLCFAGSYFVFASRGDISFGEGHAMLLLGLICGFMWGGYSSMLKYIRIESDQVAVFFLIAGLPMLALHFMFEQTVWPSTPLVWFVLIAYMLSRIAFLLWNYAMQHGQARLIGSLSYFIPLFATLSLSAAGFGDYNNIHLSLGAAFIIFGCIVINIKSLVSGFASFTRVASQ